MNGGELLRGVDFVARERNISKEVIFCNIEKAVRLAIQKCYDDEDGIGVSIDRSHRRHAGPEGRTSCSPPRNSAASPPRPPSRPSSRASAKRKATTSSTSTRPRRASWSTAPSAASRAAPPPSASARPRRCCRAANRSPANRTTSASASRRSFSKCKQGRPSRQASSCRGTIPTSCGGCSRTRSRRSSDQHHRDQGRGPRGRLSHQGGRLVAST